MPADPNEGALEYAAFVRIRAYFFNIDRGTSRLLRLIRTSSAALGIVPWRTPLVSVRLKSSAMYLLSAIGLKCVLARMRRTLGDERRLVSLPNRGDVAMYCFPNRIRIFDLKEYRIANIYNPGSPESRQHLARMVADQKLLGELGVAPRIYGVDQGNSYIEELCDGMPLKTREWWRKDVFHTVTEMARAIQSTKPRSISPVNDIVEEVNDLVVNLESLYPGAMGNTADGRLIDEIRATCDATDPDRRLEEFLSHGDLARRNILVRRDDSLVFIDWHTLDYRVKDYDVYNYHFSIIEDGSTDRMPERAVFEQLDQALGIAEADIALQALNGLRLEYYRTRLKYFMPCSGSDADRALKILAQMYDYARCFRRYEEHCKRDLSAV